jgi:imidazolonepropionase-like amidohydrolase
LCSITLALGTTAASCRDAEGDSAPRAAAPADSHFVIEGATIVGVGKRDLEIDAGKITRVGNAPPNLKRVKAKGPFIAPAVIDSHVHLAYLPKGKELATHGVAGVVDLAAPKEFLSEDHAPLTLIASGPMITAVGGYPTESWGQDGYGLEVSSPTEAVAAVDELVKLGARVIKLPVTGPPALGAETFAAAAERAHDKGLRVATHALSNAHALSAAVGGADVLAHTPVEPLDEKALAAWKGRAVVSTLSAFGGPVAIQNLSQLRKNGARVLYGTDFGNTSEPGVSEAELTALAAAGLDPKAILAALTSEPASYWGFAQLGAIEPGKAASFVVLESDPLLDPATLSKPVAVYIDGREQ